MPELFYPFAEARFEATYYVPAMSFLLMFSVEMLPMSAIDSRAHPWCVAFAGAFRALSAWISPWHRRALMDKRRAQSLGLNLAPADIASVQRIYREHLDLCGRARQAALNSPWEADDVLRLNQSQLPGALEITGPPREQPTRSTTPHPSRESPASPSGSA